MARWSQYITPTLVQKLGAAIHDRSRIDLHIRDGEFHALLGPSGCKSTLLYLTGGFLPMQQGEIVTARGRACAPGPDRSIVFQNFALFPWKTVQDNVLYGLKQAGIPSEERTRRAQHFIDLVHLTGFENPTRRSSQAACSSARRSPARSRSIRRFC